MNYIRRIGLISLALMFFVSILTISSSAQVRGRVSVGVGGGARAIPQRRVIIRRNPYYYNGFYGRGFYNRGFWGDPFWGSSFYNDPYYTNPRLRALADQAYRQERVRNSRKDIRKYTEKIKKDGQVTAKEQEKLAKKYREYEERVQDLRDGED